MPDSLQNINDYFQSKEIVDYKKDLEMKEKLKQLTNAIEKEIIQKSKPNPLHEFKKRSGYE